jgi:hypothetical protein
LAGSGLTKNEALETLAMVNHLTEPVWLAGGICADFHVGRWTREHDDIDLVAFEEDRAALSDAFTALGFTLTDDEGWITRWTRRGREVGEVSLAFMTRVDANTGNIVVRPEHSRGGAIVPGVYPGISRNLDPEGYGTVDGVSFRLVSAADEWIFTKSFATMHPGAEPDATDHHNVRLLESVLSADDLERLRPLIGRRLALEEVDAES